MYQQYQAMLAQQMAMNQQQLMNQGGATNAATPGANPGSNGTQR